MPQPDAKVKSIKLTTRTTNDGDQCVRRSPKILREARGDVDIVRLSNTNAADSGDDISIFVNPAEAQNVLDPVPPAHIVLKPGESVDWTIKSVIDGVASMNFTTDPGNCDGKDQGDLEIHC